MFKKGEKMEINIGKLIENENVKRDAIHISIYPFIADSIIEPGDHLKYIGNNKVIAFNDIPTECIAIADPFLDRIITPGKKFWGFMKPGEITDLRHSWSHEELLDDDTTDINDYDYDDECRDCF